MSDKIQLELDLEQIKLIMGLMNFADPTNFFLKPIKELLNQQVQKELALKNNEPKV